MKNGSYLITINTDEPYWHKRGQRVFTISVNGVRMKSPIDIYAHAGQLHAYQIKIPVNIRTGVLNIRFARITDQPIVDSLSVVGVKTSIAPTPSTPAPSATPTSVPTGPPTPSTTAAVPTMSTAPSTVPQAAPFVTPEEFGAKGDGSTDDTAALQAAFDDAGGRTVVLTAGRSYVHTAVLRLRVTGLHVTGPGVVLASNEQNSSVWIEADNVTLDGGITIRTASTTQRWTAWEQMGIRIEADSGDTLRDVTVDGSAAAGIYVGGATGFTLDHVTVRNTRADGIHMTGGANNGQVIDPTVVNSGDDGIAVISYTADGTPCHDIAITSPTVLGTTWGRGLSVVGGTSINETNINVANSDAAGVYVAAEGSPWYTAAPVNVAITGGVITEANTDPSIDHGAVLVLSGESAVIPASVTVTGLTITGTRSSASRDIGVVTYGASPTGVVFANLTITGGPATAYEGNTAQSAFQTRNITQNGTRLADQG